MANEPGGPPPAATLMALREECNRFLNGHGYRRAGDFLAMIPADVEMDRYGQGGVVAAFEQEVARLLGKEAALFVPSGTMAQQTTLRVHADRHGRRGVVFHPHCHLDWHEERGYERLHHLHGLPAGRLGVPLTLEDLEQVAEPPAALLLELPQRNLGGTLPSWDALVAQTQWARTRGAAVHMDGARLWEALPFYERSASQVAALFDTVYVSFYKGLGGIAGSAVAGPAEIVAEIAQWRTRHGGRLVALWPYAAAARSALAQRLSKMPQYYAHARAVAGALEGLPGVEVTPNPPVSPMMHVLLPGTAGDLATRAATLAAREHVWTFAQPFASDSPHRQRVEFSVGDATLGCAPSEVRRWMAELAGLPPEA